MIGAPGDEGQNGSGFVFVFDGASYVQTQRITEDVGFDLSFKGLGKGSKQSTSTGGVRSN